VPVPVECFCRFGVGVGVEEPVEGGEGVGGGLAGLVAGQGDRHGQARGLTAAEADVEVDLVCLGDGDVLDEQSGHSFAFPGRGGGVGPEAGEVGRQGSDAGLVFFGEGGLGGCAGPLVVLLGVVELAEGVVPVGLEAVGDQAVVGIDGEVAAAGELGAVAGSFDVAAPQGVGFVGAGFEFGLDGEGDLEGDGGDGVEEQLADNVAASFTTPSSVLRNNVEGTVNLLEAVRAHGLDPTIQICSTSEVYGHVSAEDTPIRETMTMRPASPYAVSKCAQDLLGYTYFAAYGMAIVRTRMFTYINPRRADLFASSFAKQVARVEHGLRTEVVHGNLDSVRTIIDVRDAMRAYWDALCWCRAGEAYNIGGAHTVTVGEVLDTLISLADRPIPTRLDRSLLRPADVTLQIPSVEKFVAATGWSPRYSLEESITDLLEHWRRRATTAAASR
jgi:nucleoside-diphosphate-sugar epimerase